MDVVAVVDGKEIEAILGKQRELREVIKINGQHEYPIGEGVFLGRDTSVLHDAFVEGIVGGHELELRFIVLIRMGLAGRMECAATDLCLG